MAVAAYACVLNLLRVIDNIQHPSRLRLFPDPTQVDDLRDKLCLLQDFFELHSKTITEGIESMARKIPKIAYDAEILIDNYVVDQLYRELYPPQNSTLLCGNIEYFRDEINQIIQEIKCINEALKALRTSDQEQQQPIVPDKIAVNKPQNNDHSLTSSGEKNKMVGFDDQLNHVLEKLTGNQPNLVIIPIVGMGGIGKTTLARNLFDHPYNRDHFHVRIWLTISQDYSLKNILGGLLRDGILVHKKDRECDVSEPELITQLYQKLFSQRYLIVLDDVWSAEAWDDLRRGFPDNGKGSRVVVTTRLSDIASSLGSQNNSYAMKFLEEDKSWDLFSEKAFERGGRSGELEGIGRVISKRCKGLPLLLTVVGGLLANSNMTVEYWRNVIENINSYANSANDEYCLRTVSLSYHHLPIHLKPCFLYLRHTPEDSRVKVSRLIKEWVVQGFIKPMRGKSLEEAARIYLEDLVGRNMFLIGRRSKKGNIKTCGVHDVLRDLIIKESNKEQLLEFPKTLSVRRDVNGACVICNERETDMTALSPEIIGSLSDGKILVCGSCESAFPELARSRFVVAVKYSSQDVPLPTTTRWISLHYPCNIYFYHTLHLILNLEILAIGEVDAVLPKEIWAMPQLRQVKIPSFRSPDPPSTKNDDVIVLENLQMLANVAQLKFTEEIVRRIPNLRTLGMHYYYIPRDEEDWSCFYLQNLARLRKLESLYIRCRALSMDLNAVSFPCSLKELTLVECNIAWDDLTIVGSLPSLEVLELSLDSVSGREWIPNDGEFLSLKYLKLENLDLARWRVDETHFPALETLVLYHMRALKAIPREIGELPSLKSIYLQYCTVIVVNCATAIVEEQQCYGNEVLVVHVSPLNGLPYKIGGAN